MPPKEAKEDLIRSYKKIAAAIVYERLDRHTNIEELKLVKEEIERLIAKNNKVLEIHIKELKAINDQLEKLEKK